MGHLGVRDVFKQLGTKIDNLAFRTPWNPVFEQILREIYTEKEAQVVSRMPYSLSNLDRIAKVTGFEKSELNDILKGLADKGLVMDLWDKNEFMYIPSPFVVGIFEFTMMRAGGVDFKKMAGLFSEYMENGGMYEKNLGKDQKISVMRAMPHEESIQGPEILDYEKASHMLTKYKKFAIGVCSCRHEKFHSDEGKCDAPLEMCSSFDSAADYLIRHNLAKEVSREEMQDNLIQARDSGLVLSTENVMNNAKALCCCCGCCCNLLQGISKYGYPNAITTSSFIAEVDNDECKKCKLCIKACPINAITMDPISKDINIDENICIGCGVCVLSCKFGSIKMEKRKQRVLVPETIFERIILQSLERGTLQYQIFDNPQSSFHKIMNAFVGGFLKLPPVKKSLMSETFQSVYLTKIRKGYEKLKGIDFSEM
jgi:Pyruvate/2-oxoacid:ferredoxin oxidoreductase delta subunit